MNSHTHFLVAFALALAFVEKGIFTIELAVLCGVIAVFIDVDHYIEHIIHAKSNRFSLKATWNNSIKLHRFDQRSFVHHKTGILIVTVLLAIVWYFSWKIAFLLAISYYSHMLLDYVHIKTKSLRLSMFGMYQKISHAELLLDMCSIVILVGFLI